MPEPSPFPPYPAPPPPGRNGAGAPSLLASYAGPQAPERYGLHAVLFLATLVTTTWVGASQLIGRDAVYAAEGWAAQLTDGLLYAVPFLLFLTVHEFGHYLTARARGVAVSLPYYIPVPFALGTLGAVIRIREPLRRTRVLFDVGAAGPLAGFAVALALVLVGLATMPPPSYLLGVSGHEGLVRTVEATGVWPHVRDTLLPGQLATLFGDTLLWKGLMALHPHAPPGYELQHYPLLLAGWLGLFFTALNLLPIGQLDGGHVVYALFGPRVHAVVARVTAVLLVTSGALGAARDLPLITAELAVLAAARLGAAGPALERAFAWGLWAAWPLLVLILFALMRRYFGGRALPGLAAALAMTGAVALAARFAPPLIDVAGYTGWLLWSALILFLIRLDHPPVLVHEPLDGKRRAAGYLCLALFVLCFSPKPLEAVQAVVREEGKPPPGARIIVVDAALVAPEAGVPAAEAQGTTPRIAARGGAR